MKVQAVESYNEPKYPTKKEIWECPKLMRQSMSESRLKLLGAGLSGALFTVLTFAGCEDKPISRSEKTSQIEAIEEKPSAVTEEPARKKAETLIAPLFDHGNGRGSTGCIVMNPPVFLSEEEAYTIINEELAKHGVNFDLENVTIDGDIIKIHVIDYPDNRHLESPKIKIDLYDSRKKIFVEFVSRDDHFGYQLRQSAKTGKFFFSTVSDYDMKKAGQYWRDELNFLQAEGVFGLFYDPLDKSDKKNSSNELRKQVQEFAEWLNEKELI